MTVVTGTNRLILIHAKVIAESTVATDIIELDVREGSTALDIAYATLSQANHGVELICNVPIKPSPGVHTYKLSLGRTLGTGTLTMDTAGSFGSTILAEDVGSDSLQYVLQGSIGGISKVVGP